ncbi:unnamed protein product [Somion occarium]|uniref:HAT C-terminal dimerisation domain-containing protein n=1 Tax=Somion occarium TaxID=3059160 RepID=A0ABP1E5N2_9APHY
MLADCMLEVIRCARELMFRVPFAEGHDHLGFWLHAKSVFNEEFHRMNTDTHNLALFLHPLCRRIAVGQAGKGRTFDQICKAALDIARQLRWPEVRAVRLLDNLKEYYSCKGPFVGGQSDAKAWWLSLPILATEGYPIKDLAVQLHSIVPHAAEVERLFSNLGGIQGRKRINLTVPNFEREGRMRSNYERLIWEHNRKAGKPLHRNHAHMHTRNTPGINTDLAKDLDINFTWIPPLAVTSVDEAMQREVPLEGPEGMTDEQFAAEYEEWERQRAEEVADDNRDVDPVLLDVVPTAGEIYDFTELDRIDRGMAPASFNEEVQMPSSSTEAVVWNVDTLLRMNGMEF